MLDYGAGPNKPGSSGTTMTNRIEKPTHLADAVEYQDGSVVSRVLFRTDMGTLTRRKEITNQNFQK